MIAITLVVCIVPEASILCIEQYSCTATLAISMHIMQYASFSLSRTSAYIVRVANMRKNKRSRRTPTTTGRLASMHTVQCILSAKERYELN